MNYKKYFADELTSLKSQGLYRKFRQINRNQINFPKATERFEGKERAVEVWCSNDYLNLSQHPVVILESIKVTSIPFFAREYAVVVPAIPAPIIATFFFIATQWVI